jgi:hypothetical protein
MFRRSFALSRRIFKWIFVSLTIGVVFVFASNLIIFPTYRHLPSRALAPNSASCVDAESGWDILATTPEKNSEWSAVDQDEKWKRKFSCSIQHHIIPGYNSLSADGTKVDSLSYDLAFIEFQEDGKPYALREECGLNDKCVEERNIPVHLQNRGQIEPLIEKLASSVKNGDSNYVIAFVHGWRHDAELGDTNVADFRIYAAHAARFLVDRAAKNPDFKRPHVTAVYLGWRGARTDETWLKRHIPWIGETIGTVSALATLFDRKPVSETVAPAALSALRDIEHVLSIDAYRELPVKSPNKMIVFGHSLGGNMLITALQDPLIKQIESHKSGDYLQPVLGDLVVLINPAAEASKWTSIQRTVWYKLALINGERRSPEDYEESQKYFRDNQRPIIVAATAARNWPPGGREQVDCTVSDPVRAEQNQVVQKTVDYDWATHDMFPAFKGDLRPLADRIEQWGTERDPNDECAQQGISGSDFLFHPLRAGAIWASAVVRVFPFMTTDPEQTHTIGNLDPPRPLSPKLAEYGATMRPFGTTHELLRSEKRSQYGMRKMSLKDPDKEIPLNYEDVVTSEAACPVAANWLSRVKAERIKQEGKEDAKPATHYATNWDTFDLLSSGIAGEGYPALRFIHGFEKGGIAPPTRPNDPFWNLRAFDTALAEHDGYMLSSFICAMNQLVLDDITTIQPAKK